VGQPRVQAACLCDRNVKAILAAATLAVCFVAAEIGLRLYAAQSWRQGRPAEGEDVRDFQRLMRLSAHPEIGIELRPRLNVRFLGRPFQTNAPGYRGRDFPTDKPAGLFRVVGLGDSVMMGWGAGQQETYLARLEALLNEHFGPGRVEVLNFAVSGYNTAQEYYVLKDIALAYHPDLIILGYVGNDFEPPNFHRTPKRFNSRSCALNWLVSRIQVKLHLIAPDELYDWRPFSGDLGRVPAGFEEAFTDIAQLTSEQRIPLINVLDSRYQSEFLSHHEVAALGAKLGVQTLDLYHLYRHLPKNLPRHKAVTIDDAHNRLYSIVGDTHANALWHERTARVLKDFILQRGLIEPARAK